jgi:hypothetical protein
VRQLEVVAVSDDGNHVLLAASEDGRPTHELRIDNRLVAAINGELDDDDEHRESELSPKEIQARLRAGDTVEQVAKAARIPVARIMIYATPVISERDRIVDQARAAKLTRPRGPESTAALGTVVTKRLTEIAGLRPETVEWGTKRREDGAWVVSLSYAARGGSRTALWLWRPNGRELTSINALGTRLGAQDPPSAVRHKRPAPAAAPAPARRAPAKRAPKRAAAATPTKSTSRSARAAAKPAQRSPRPAPRIAPQVEPKMENGRVVMPSWDDVLLGVTSSATARGRRRS